MQNDIQRLLNPALQNIATYRVEGGQQAEVKLNQNESPFDVPMWLKEEILGAFQKESWNRYPDILPYRGMQAYADFLGVAPECVMMSNGSNEMLYTIFLACLGPSRKVLIPEPSFSLYEKIALLLQSGIVRVPMQSGLDFDTEAIIRAARDEAVHFIVLSTPNNPTSKSLALEDVRLIAESCDAIVLVDEAYIEFSRQRSALELIDELPNVVVLRTMSKALALAGIRIGFAIANPALMAELAKPKIPFASGRLQEITIERVLANYSLVTDAVSYILHERARLYSELLSIDGVEALESDTNFLIIRVPDAGSVFQALQKEGILVRNVSGYPMMKNCLRFNVGLVDENRALIEKLRSI
ncbi:histidinol-phosphate transaminase [Chlorobium sp. BLA1]|uniref:histidinol-phosphate transaminase n=1 Tax=Candidatus Chlorobium masyuteum TaxID=2716876 RepID=UPI00141F6E1D|nr:histidinol-phosphate transaminase [Candidatus Chlorobium masyuteum]NHQ60986.1 histidinol-phosphate transaminase [Candidatus Chlorobium masyuteum]